GQVRAGAIWRLFAVFCGFLRVVWRAARGGRFRRERMSVQSRKKLYRFFTKKGHFFAVKFWAFGPPCRPGRRRRVPSRRYAEGVSRSAASCSHVGTHPVHARSTNLRPAVAFIAHVF